MNRCYGVLVAAFYFRHRQLIWMFGTGIHSNRGNGVYVFDDGKGVFEDNDIRENESVRLCLCLSVRPCLCLLVRSCLFVYMSAHVFVCWSVHIFLFIGPPMSVFVGPSVPLFVGPSMSLFVG
jgi:hypothetical protein